MDLGLLMKLWILWILSLILTRLDLSLVGLSGSRTVEHFVELVTGGHFLTG